MNNFFQLLHLTQNNLLGATPIRNGLTVTTRHESLDQNQDLVSPELLSQGPLTVAILDSNVSPASAVLSQVQSRTDLRLGNFCLQTYTRLSSNSCTILVVVLIIGSNSWC